MYNIYSLIFLIALIVMICILLVSNIRMFSLKFVNISVKDNSVRYLFVILSAIIIVLVGVQGLAPVIILYILLSLINNWFIRMK